MTEIIPFPLNPDHILSFQQAVSSVESRDPVVGIIVGYDVNDNIFIINFGDISRKDALWISEQLRRHAFGDSLS